MNVQASSQARTVSDKKPIVSDYARSASTSTTRPKRILHVLSISVPHLNGYTMRSRYIVNTIRAKGEFEPYVVTSPFYPGNSATVESQDIDGTRYQRIPHPADRPGLKGPEQFLCATLYRIRQWAKRKSRSSEKKSTLKLMFRSIGRVARFLVLLLASLAMRLCGLVAMLGRRIEKSYRKSRRFARRPPGALRVWQALLRVFYLFLRVFRRGFRFLVRLFRRFQRPVFCRLRRYRQFAVRFMRRMGRFSIRQYRKARRAVHRSINRPLIRICQDLEDVLLIRHMRRRLREICREVRPDLIHAHSPYRCGQAALDVARSLKVPMVYEVRGLWEESSVAEGNWTRSDREYIAWREKDTRVILGADAVICICEQLRKEVIERGVDADRVFIAPNAVCSDVFMPIRQDVEPPEAVRKIRRLLRPHTVGYVGSVRRMEGVAELLLGASAMLCHGCDISVMVIGGGKGLDELRLLAEELGLGDRAVFTGPVPHEHIQYYYDCIDVFAITRPDVRVARMVTPLKPLEAMAMGKAVVLSDLPALREMVIEDRTGLLYRPGDFDHLAQQCVRLIEDSELRERLGRQAREWVCRERTWEQAIESYGPAYDTARELASARRSHE